MGQTKQRSLQITTYNGPLLESLVLRLGVTGAIGLLPEDFLLDLAEVGTSKA